ncbi:alpha/beta hydrolase [Sphingomonas lacunae]|nr:alpha/beta hydrolase [Sphingomonas lacunae]
MLDTMAQAGFALPDPLEPASLRAFLDVPIPGPAVDIAERCDLAIGCEGRQLPARLYHPEPDQVLPLILFFHGGGWVHGTLDTHDRLAATLANETRCAVLSIGYRLAPEHPFPAAYDDALAAIAWAKSEAARLGIDAGRMAVAGDSAGGNLAAAAAQSLAGDLAICHQLLFYPALDASCSTPSFQTEFPGFLSARQMRWYWDQYAPDRVGEALASDQRASPLAGPISPYVAPATIVVAGNDPLHDEAAAFAAKMEAAGVAVALHSYPGGIHGFASMVGMVPLADEAVSAAASALRTALCDGPVAAGLDNGSRKR